MHVSARRAGSYTARVVRRSRRPRTLAVALLLAVGLLPGLGTTAGAQPELDDLREEIDEAQSGLERLDAEVEVEVDALDQVIDDVRAGQSELAALNETCRRPTRGWRTVSAR